MCVSCVGVGAPRSARPSTNNQTIQQSNQQTFLPMQAVESHTDREEIYKDFMDEWEDAERREQRAKKVGGLDQ